ncbi:MAG: VOC family protein [Rhizobiaceae bacterium]|nr:VOC family protein [Hyphomicrobiales bacterium]NRB30481.1 VOC family protein [Rhizobiaceae bacterium]
MTANISIVTLGVEDLVASTAFYEKIGWSNTTASQDSVTFLQGHSVVLGLYGRAALAEDAEVDPAGSGFRGVSLAINLESEAAVDQFFDKAVSCGAAATKKPQKVFWGGYSGYFSDPDGHLWEVAFNPFFQGDVSTGQLALEAKQT